MSNAFCALSFELYHVVVCFACATRKNPFCFRMGCMFHQEGPTLMFLMLVLAAHFLHTTVPRRKRKSMPQTHGKRRPEKGTACRLPCVRQVQPRLKTCFCASQVSHALLRSSVLRVTSFSFFFVGGGSGGYVVGYWLQRLMWSIGRRSMCCDEARFDPWGFLCGPGIARASRKLLDLFPFVNTCAHLAASPQGDRGWLYDGFQVWSDHAVRVRQVKSRCAQRVAKNMFETGLLTTMCRTKFDFVSVRTAVRELHT